MLDKHLSESQAWLTRRLKSRVMEDLCQMPLGLCTTSSLKLPAGYERSWCDLKRSVSGSLTQAHAAGVADWRAIAVFCNLFEEDEVELLARFIRIVDSMNPNSPQIFLVPHTTAPENRPKDMKADIVKYDTLNFIMYAGIDGVIAGEPEGDRLALAIKARIKHAKLLVKSAFDAMNEVLDKKKYMDFLIECNHAMLWDYARTRLAASIPPVDGSLPHGVPHVLTSCTVGKELGQGSSGTVYKLHRLKGQSTVNDLGRVAKLTSKDTVKNIADLKRMKRTIDVMRLMSFEDNLHPNIVQLFGVFHSQTHIMLVMEDGGPLNLHRRLCDRSHTNSEKRREMSLKIVESLILQIVAVIQHIHIKLCMCHRDIKPENMIVMEIDDDIRLKLIDFDMAFLCCQTSKCKSPCGTLPFTAPEVLSGKEYDGRQADMWSLGMSLMEILCGVGIVEQVLTMGRPQERSNVSIMQKISRGLMNKEAAGEMVMQCCLEELHPLREVMLQALSGLLDVNAKERWDAQSLKEQIEASLPT